MKWGRAGTRLLLGLLPILSTLALLRDTSGSVANLSGSELCHFSPGTLTFTEVLTMLGSQNSTQLCLQWRAAGQAGVQHVAKELGQS